MITDVSLLVSGWGPFVQVDHILGDRIRWGPLVQGDQFYEDHLSRGTESGGPEVRGSNGFRTKCVAADLSYYFVLVHLLFLAVLSRNTWSVPCMLLSPDGP